MSGQRRLNERIRNKRRTRQEKAKTISSWRPWQYQIQITRLSIQVNDCCDGMTLTDCENAWRCWSNSKSFFLR
jgi:hypothetical protein